MILWLDEPITKWDEVIIEKIQLLYCLILCDLHKQSEIRCRVSDYRLSIESYIHLGVIM